MPVLNTSWWNPYADREAQQLICDVLTSGPDGRVLPAFKVVFPKCRIWRDASPLDRQWVARTYSLASVPSAVWMVEPVTAMEPVLQSTKIRVQFPQEPTVRGPLTRGGLIDVLPVDSLGGLLTLPSNGISPARTGRVRVTLPRAVGRPVGLGLWQYVVDAVECPGEVEW